VAAQVVASRVVLSSTELVSCRCRRRRSSSGSSSSSSGSCSFIQHSAKDGGFRSDIFSVRCIVFTAVIMKNSVFRDVTSYGPWKLTC
jgi:hypothetical protein